MRIDECNAEAAGSQVRTEVRVHALSTALDLILTHCGVLVSRCESCLTLCYRFYMSTIYTSISSKGQLVIPAELREQMKLSAGTKVSIQKEGNTLVVRPITPEFIDSLIGCTKGAGAERERMHRDDEKR